MAETKDRRMPLRRKAETDGPSVFMSFHLRDIRLCHSSWPSPSRRRTSPRRMPPRRMPMRRMSPRRMSPRRTAPRRRKVETDATETDVPETDVPETDVPETEEGGDGGRPRRMSPRRKVCCWWSFSTLWKALVDLPVSLSWMIAVVYVGAYFVMGYSFDDSIV